MNPNAINHSLIKRGDFRVQGANVDPIWENGMNQVEVILLTRLDDAGVPVDKVALRILNETFVVAVRITNGRSLTLTFDEKHIPSILKESDYKLIADGVIASYREHVLPKKVVDEPGNR